MASDEERPSSFDWALVRDANLGPLAPQATPIVSDAAPVMGDSEEVRVTPTRGVGGQVECPPHERSHVTHADRSHEWRSGWRPAYRPAGDYPARYAAFQVANAQEDPQCSSTTWEHGTPPNERPTVRQRLNDLAVIVSDGCYLVPRGFQHQNMLCIDTLLTSAHSMISIAYEIMALVNELDHVRCCPGNRCNQCDLCTLIVIE